ncbi:MAG TPA: TIGR01777 family oxidoreductase [Puia sp.]|nr:TIGR01777 family oxidoreductase [Puia sp.]
MKNKKIVIAGGSGFIGQALAARWGKDNRVVILGRQGARTPDNTYGRRALTAAEGYHVSYVRWNGREVEPNWAAAIDGCDLVLNLAGRSVNCRYNRRNRQEILDSRVNATSAIGQAIRDATIPPKLWINAASATIYRHAQDRPQDEFTGEQGSGFSVNVCQSWEKAFFEQRTPFTRKVALRTAITLGEGGVLVPYVRLVRCGLGGKQGSGRQMYSWVHIEDIGRSVEWFFDHPELEGAYNIAAPGPVTNERFMATLRRLMGRRFGVPAPAWLLKFGALLIGTETELILKSRWVIPTKLERTGFVFAYPRLEDALKAALRTSSGSKL